VRATGRFVRIEVERAAAPDRDAVIAAIAALPGVGLVEPRDPDMESTLRHLATAA
jgi:hypothetical protein